MPDHSDRSADTEKTNLTHLPLDVLRLVFEFYEGSYSLTATNRYFFIHVRQRMYLRLNRKYSFIYHTDRDFRTLVHARVDNPSKQLSLDLHECIYITDVSTLGGVHTLDLSYCSYITDVSALQGVPFYQGPDRF